MNPMNVTDEIRREISYERLISQDRVIESFKDQGTELTRRMLTYWRSKGLLEPLTREGNGYLMSFDDVERVRVLIQLKEQEEEILFIHTIDGKGFNITRMEVRKIGRVVYRLLYTDEGGKLIKEMSADEYERTVGRASE